MAESVQNALVPAGDTNSSRLFFGAVCTAFALVLLGAVNAWQYLVNQIVLEPYLAQTYCLGHLAEWDPKITTPPGLYMINYMLSQVGASCTIPALRFTNVLFLAVGVFPLAFIYRSSWSTTMSPAVWARFDPARLQRWIADAHTALNIALFPPLFFFSALYYTDVASTAFVLATLFIYKLRDSYPHDAAEEMLRTIHIVVALTLAAQRQWMFLAMSFAAAFLTSLPVRPFTLSSNASEAPPPRSDSVMRKVIWLAGILSLAFRQTNIFWVAVFPVSLSLLDSVRGRVSKGSSLSALVRESSFARTFYNPALYNVSLQDFVSSIASMAACLAGTFTFMMSHPFSIQAKALLTKLAPYVSLILVFIAFVLWNGGIVLGDKSNHIATIHLSQMLYIWPYFVFFSIPVVLPNVLASILPEGLTPSFLQKYGTTQRPSFLSMGLFATSLVTILGVVHFNTIVHPFTLADNRHYVFYIFRILRLNPALYYLAAPVYLFCGWAVITTLGIREVQKPGEQKNAISARGGNPANQGPSINFLVTWLATTALCLIGAPLVEPRYFILPWILWRLEVPSPSVAAGAKAERRDENVSVDTASSTTGRDSNNSTSRRKGKTSPEQALKAASSSDQQDEVQLSWQQLLFSDPRLWAETAWHLLINAATGYIFLYRGFEWIQEPGHVQRFLW